MIVAYPVPAAIGLSDLSDFATQATARLLSLGLRCSHLSLAGYSIRIRRFEADKSKDLADKQ